MRERARKRIAFGFAFTLTGATVFFCCLPRRKDRNTLKLVVIVQFCNVNDYDNYNKVYHLAGGIFWETFLLTKRNGLKSRNNNTAPSPTIGSIIIVATVRIKKV